MFCAISGEVPQEPVASKKNGYLYERRLIEKYIKEEGKCPVSGIELVESDLVTIQSNKAVKPRTVASAGVPGILQMLQNEWDEHMIEMFTLKQHLDATRQELSQALYQHDAACRVIARLMRERDEARAMLTTLQSQGVAMPSIASSEGANGEGAAMEEDTVVDGSLGPGLNEEVLKKINDKCAELSSARKGRKLPEGLATKETVGGYTVTATHSPHKSDKPGVLSVAIQPTQDLSGSHLVLTGGVDKDAILFERGSGQVVSKLTGHSKKVSSVAFHPGWDTASEKVLFTASADKSVKVWKGRENESSQRFAEAVTIFSHTGEVTGLSIHPTGDFAVSTSLDGAWSFLDIHRGASLRNVRPGDSSPLHSGLFHPDGLILATGADDATVRIWDVREQNNVATLAEHTAAVSSLAFSENGYLLASGSHDGSVRVWDLRKLKCTKNFTVGDGSQPVNAVSFDYSGSFLAIASSELTVMHVKASKEWSDVPLQVAVKSAHSKPIHAVAWGPLAAFLVSTSADRTVKVYS